MLNPNQLTLIKPNKMYFQSYLEAIDETPDQLEQYGYLDMPWENAADYMERFRLGEGLPEGYVRSTYLWFVCEKRSCEQKYDEPKFIGQVNIRHALTDNLMNYGGHIGYSIRKSEQGKGYGKLILHKTIMIVRQNFNFTKVLITCDDDNYASAKVIENNGGVLQDKIHNLINGKQILTRRYWITLPESQSEKS